ncbi:MAG: Crp/Fnr family transcriptional regulator [Elusimicrobia bacterium]|nr:Crp/Fnr family transcriptional regulator [Elusimicrobiota bacterium]
MDKRALEAFFAAHEAFRRTPPAALRRLAAVARPKPLAAGEHLFREGDPAGEAAVLTKGLAVSSIGRRSGRSAMVEVLRAGDVWGVLSSLTGGANLCDVRALEPSAAVLLPAAELFRLADSSPALSRALLRAAEVRFRRLADLHALSGERSPRKICGILLWLHGSAGESVPLTQAAIAELAGLALETVSRAMSAYKKRGWISYTRRRITIERPDLLRRFLEDA